MQKFSEGFECPKKFERFGVLFASGNSTTYRPAKSPYPPLEDLTIDIKNKGGWDRRPGRGWTICRDRSEK